MIYINNMKLKLLKIKLNPFKKCRYCYHILLKSKFNKHPKTLDRRQSYCKNCQVLLNCFKKMEVSMQKQMIKYKAKDGSIQERQKVGEDAKGYYILVENRKKPKHIKHEQVISVEKE